MLKGTRGSFSILVLLLLLLPLLSISRSLPMFHGTTVRFCVFRFMLLFPMSLYPSTSVGREKMNILLFDQFGMKECESFY